MAVSLRHLLKEDVTRVMEICVESPPSFYMGRWEGVKTLRECDFKNPRCGFRDSQATPCTHDDTVAYLAIHTYIVTYQISSSSKSHLEYLSLGHTRHVVPNTSHPDTL